MDNNLNELSELIFIFKERIDELETDILYLKKIINMSLNGLKKLD